MRGDLTNATDLAGALGALLWTPTLDPDGNIVALELRWDVKDSWVTTWEQVFDAIAPFVTAGSYPRLHDENYGQHMCWRWWFDGASCSQLPEE